MKPAILVFLCGLAMSSPLNAQSVDLTTYEGLKAALDSGKSLLIVDVRTEDLYASGHIPGAVNFPFAALWYQNPSRNLNQIIVVYGRPASAESRKASDLLRHKGYQNVVLFGSISKWSGELVK